MKKEIIENRKTVVTWIEIRQNDPTSGLSFEKMAKRHGIEIDTFWVVSMSTRHGSRPEETALKLFVRQEDAQAYFDAHPVGTVQHDPRNIAEFVKSSSDPDFVERIFDDPNSTINMLRAGDEDGYLTWQTLKDAGINDGLNVNPEILEYLGRQRVKKIQTIHGDNWKIAAEMEFCFLTLPSSSSAYVAAQQQYNYYIANDDFAAGYLLRDLETLVYGVEQAAQRAAEFAQRQTARAAKGGEAIAQKAEQRRKTFFKIALESVPEWVWKSEKEQIRFLKKLSTQHDQGTGDDLFKHGSKTLSNQWFVEALSSLRQSGELETYMSKKP